MIRPGRRPREALRPRRESQERRLAWPRLLPPVAFTVTMSLMMCVPAAVAAGRALAGQEWLIDHRHALAVFLLTPAAIVCWVASILHNRHPMRARRMIAQAVTLLAAITIVGALELFAAELWVEDVSGRHAPPPFGQRVVDGMVLALLASLLLWCCRRAWRLARHAEQSGGVEGRRALR